MRLQEVLIRRFEHEDFASNTYAVLSHLSNEAWLIDAGSVDQVLNAFSGIRKIDGLFLTHYHYDHIFGIGKLVLAYPECIIYASSHTIEGLSDPKMNLSFYHNVPIQFGSLMTKVIKDFDKISIFDSIHAEVFSTPGHNPGCLTFKIGNFIFTGDSYIPGYDVVTRLPGGNKQESQISLQRIFQLMEEETIICPGHGNMLKS